MSMRQRESNRSSAQTMRPAGRKAGMNTAGGAAAENVDMNRRQSIEELTGGRIKKK